MKLLKIAVFGLLWVSTFIACKKDKDDSPPASTNEMVGNWVGKYGYDTNSSTYYYAFQIKSDGTMKEINQYGVVKGEGTWSVSGNQFTATYHSSSNSSVVYVVKATVNAGKNNLTGTWGYGSAMSDGGAFYMNK